jgi:hypothetical protein
MKKLLISCVVVAAAVGFAGSASAAKSKHMVSADVQSSCKAQAAKKYSAIHFLKRRNFVNSCVAERSKAHKARAVKAEPVGKAAPATTAQAPKN